MEKTIEKAGDVLGILGIIICAVAGIARLFGLYYLLGFQSTTLFTGGIALMVMACLAKLHFLSKVNSVA